MKKVILLLLGLFVAGIAIAAVPLEIKKEKVQIENVYQVAIEKVTPAVIQFNMAQAREVDTAGNIVFDGATITKALRLPATLKGYRHASRRTHYNWRLSSEFNPDSMRPPLRS